MPMLTSTNEAFTNLKLLIGDEVFLRRQKACATVIGLGGVGSWAAEALARSGLGKIILIDLDDICVSNINRQIHALTTTIGKNKVAVMQERLRQINPALDVVVINDFLHTENIAQYVQTSHFVIDAIDSLKIKCTLIDYCRRQNIPLVTTGAAGGKTNPTLIQCQDLSKSYNDTLLQRVRKKLRRDFAFPQKKKEKFQVQAVFSTELLPQTNQEPTASITESKIFCDEEKMATNCSNGLGTCITVTASFGLMAAHQLLQMIDRRE